MEKALGARSELDAKLPSRTTNAAWLVRLTLLLVSLDVVAAVVGAAVALALHGPTPPLGLKIGAFAGLPALFAGLVAFVGGYEESTIAASRGAYTQVSKAGAALIGISSAIAYAADNSPLKGYIFVSVPLAILVSLLCRRTVIAVLRGRRIAGRNYIRALAVGDEDSALALIKATRREPYAGLRIEGVCLADPDNCELLQRMGVPNLGPIESTAEAARLAGIEIVIVTNNSGLSTAALRRLSWDLERIDVRFALTLGLMDVSSWRLRGGLLTGDPLVEIEAPELRGARRALKAIFDRLVALGALIALLPAMACIGLLIRLTSPGPALWRQTRIGRDGREFTMIKFRTMVQNASQLRAEVLESALDGALFKMRSDPRITRVGRILRRYSLDELPQLLNVLAGSMSLVGPRPPLPTEVAQYGDDVRRRLLVKPGLTGLWQISGRSDLPWEESVRLDLYYVENWSLSSDLAILWRTVGSVFRGSGAY